MKAPLVSFIMPTYNRADSILTAIESIRAQTEPRWELIVVDDAGDDDTEAVIARLRDERISYYRQAKNRGPGAARNAGLAHAKADWVAYLDSDNELCPTYSQTMLDHLARHPQAVFAFPRAHRTEELWLDGKLVKLIDDSADTPPNLTLKDIFMKKLNVDTNGFMHRRSVYDEGIRWDEQLRHGMEDWDLAMQIGERWPDGFVYVPEVLYHYHQRYGGDGVVSNSAYRDWADTLEYIYQKHQNDKLLSGQDWYPRKVEKWQRLQKEYEAGKLPPYYLHRFQDVPKLARPKSAGFTPLGIVIAVVITGVVALTAAYVWRHHRRLPHSVPVPSNYSGWLTYKSDHSSVQFSYPASWKLVRAQVSGYDLEGITLQGPNDFQMAYQLETNHVNPAMSCARATFGGSVKVNSKYVIIPTLDNSDISKVLGINLMASGYAGSTSGCGLGFYPNPVNDHMGFTFWGGYLTPVPGSSQYTYNKKPAAGYFDLPEVRAAKAIFASFKE